mgnify:CR=1 FL=1
MDNAVSPELILLGTGGATPYANRANATAAVVTQDGNVLFDAGSGVCQRLDQAGIDAATVDIICLSHLHADHCLELPLLILSSFLAGRKHAIKVIGPQGTQRLYDTLMGDIFNYIPGLVSGVTGRRPVVDVTEWSPGETYQHGSLIIRSAPALHTVPALAYRLEIHGRAIAYSGDTEYSDDVIELARDVDVLVHECPFPVEMGQVPGHTTANEVGLVASAANAGMVVLTHLFAETLGHEDEMLAAVRERFSGQVLLGVDLTRLHVGHNE